MKTIFVTLIALSAAITGFSQPIAYQYKLEFEVIGSSDTVAYLGHHFGDKRYVDDTASVSNGKSVFTKNKTLKEGLYFYYAGPNYFEFIIDEDKEFQIITQSEDFVKNMKITGSDQNQLFREMQVFVSDKSKEMAALTKRIESTTDSLEKKNLGDQFLSLDNKVKSYQKSVAMENSGKLISRMMYALQSPSIPDNVEEMTQTERYLYYKKAFLQNFNIADDGLLRTPLYQPKLMEYLDKVIIQDADTVIKEVDMIMSEAQRSYEVYRYLTVSLASKYENSPIMGHDKVFVHFIEKYYLSNTPEWLSPDVKKSLQDRVATMKFSYIGMEAPKMVLNDTSMNNISLYGIDSDYIVMYFYDPDCGHCKKKTPIMIEAYHNLKGENVEFLGINITTNNDRWKEYINEVGLDWTNLSDNYNRSNFRYYYDIRSTPTIYILDSEKKIIAKKLDANQVEDFIRQDIELKSKENQDSGQ